jgi:hypothetical protein
LVHANERMTIHRPLAILCALLLASPSARAQEVTLTGRLVAQPNSLIRNHYVQTYTIDSRPNHPLKSVQLSSTEFDAVLIAVAPDGMSYDDDDSAGDQNARLDLPSRTGEWLIIVTADQMQRTGSFTLAVDGPAPVRANRPLPRAAIDRLPGVRSTSVTGPAHVDTVRIVKVDTVRVVRADTVFKTKVDTIVRTTPAPTRRGTTPR